MKKLDTLSEDTTIPCPECKKQMEQQIIGKSGFFEIPTYYGYLISDRLVFICDNEKCKFFGIPKPVKYFLSNKFWKGDEE